jgi:hypothetical protein
MREGFSDEHPQKAAMAECIESSWLTMVNVIIVAGAPKCFLHRGKCRGALAVAESLLADPRVAIVADDFRSVAARVDDGLRKRGATDARFAQMLRVESLHYFDMKDPAAVVSLDHDDFEGQIGKVGLFQFHPQSLRCSTIARVNASTVMGAGGASIGAGSPSGVM